MTSERDIELQLRRHLVDRADPSLAQGQIDRLLATTSVARQRSRWSGSAHLVARGVGSIVPRTSRTALVLISAAILLLLGAIYLAGSNPRPRPPFNGLILFGRFEEAAGDTVVYTIHPDGTGLHQVTPEPAEEPHWSHDGQRILLGDRIVSPEGVVLQRYEADRGTFHVQCPFFSPDETRLLCEGFDDDATADLSLHGIYTVRASDGEDLRRVTPGGAYGPVDGYAPDGRKILFHTPHEGAQSGPLFVIDANGANLRRLGDLDVNSASWAPDGRSVLVASQRVLYRVDLATGAAERIQVTTIPDAQIVGAVWSPDQTQILFKRITTNIDLWVINADGSGVHQITSDPLDERYIDWGTHPLDP
jgi:Tol biopolymer transport system component